MDWFFAENIGQTHLITGEDAVHITKSLRMSVGEVITLCDSKKIEHLCMIERITPDGVLVKVVSENECLNEPTVDVTLFAALTKGDKMETVIQKAVEIGVHSVIPFATTGLKDKFIKIFYGYIVNMFLGKAVFTNVLRQKVLPFVYFQYITVKFPFIFPFAYTVYFSVRVKYRIIYRDTNE